MSVYNGDKNLAQTIESLLSQTEKNWEGIFINDGSTDQTASILDAYSASDKRIKPIHRLKNGGLTSALNEGLQKAQAAYFARQDVDDLSHPDRLKKQADYLDQNLDVAVVGCSFNVMDEDGRVLSQTVPCSSKTSLKNQLAKRNVLAHGSLMMRKESIVQLGGYRSQFQMAQDYDLLLRVLRSHQIASLPEALYSLRIGPTGGSIRKLDMQNFFAQLARQCAALPDNEADQNRFIEEALKEIPTTKASESLVQQRYQFLKSVHLLKAGKTEEARSQLAGIDEPSIRSKAALLRMLTYTPSWMRQTLRLVKRYL